MRAPSRQQAPLAFVPVRFEEGEAAGQSPTDPASRAGRDGRKGKGTKPACYIMGAVQIYCLVLAGQLAEFGEVYYAISCGGTALTLAWMIWVTDLEDGASCAWAFGRGSAYPGAAISVGLLAEFCARKYVF